MYTVLIVAVHPDNTVITGMGVATDIRAALTSAYNDLNGQVKAPPPPPAHNNGSSPGAGAEDEPTCPKHGMSRRSKWGGWFCPAPDDTEPKGYCAWRQRK